ncbi:fungal-specific transcription factor domain-containing protein [Aspergillus crustosus]
MSGSTTRKPYRVGPGENRRCWTCRDRKVSCDYSRPTCQNCTNAKRKCEGYGLRLSWPTARGPRRSTLTQEDQDSLLPTETYVQSLGFVNATTDELQMHYLQDSQLIERLRERNIRISPLVRLIRSPTPMNGDEKHLVSFFMTSVISSLCPSPTDSQKLWRLLFKLSFCDDSHATMAVLRAILALSTLYRYGLSREAVRLKVAALSSLRASTEEGSLGPWQIYQHVAVGMLLCAFEIFGPSQTCVQWPMYVSGAKVMLQQLGGQERVDPGEADTLILWVHYHDVLARVSASHWRLYQGSIAISPEPLDLSRYAISTPATQIQGVFGCSLQMMNLISSMSSYGSNPTSNKNSSSIEYDILSLKQTTQPSNDKTPPTSPPETTKETKIAELYRLASLIYHTRILQKLTGSSQSLETHVQTALNIISTLDTCSRPFPLLIIGSEACGESQRAAVLALLSRTRAMANQRTMACGQRMIECMWLQHDLARSANTGMDFGGVLNDVISTCDHLPPLA